MKTIGIIGIGNMGQAIARRLYANYELYIFDKETAKTKGVSCSRVCKDLASLVICSDLFILAVKPQDLGGVLNIIKYNVDAKIVVSVAAGITTIYIENVLGKAKVVRAMPNMPAKIGEGMVVLSRGRFVTQMDFDFVNKMFGFMGQTLEIQENMMNAATAVSGSGPAYVCRYINSSGGMDKISQDLNSVFIKDFRAAAESVGFSTAEANTLVDKTFYGTIDFIKKTGVNPSDLEKQVTSKGGTTEAALGVLGSGGSLLEAVKAALKRAEELSRG